MAPSILLVTSLLRRKWRNKEVAELKKKYFLFTFVSSHLNPLSFFFLTMLNVPSLRILPAGNLDPRFYVWSTHLFSFGLKSSCPHQHKLCPKGEA